MYYPAIVSSDEELLQILNIQKKNLKQNISEKEKQEQGFITMGFSLPMLQAMHELAPSIIVKDANGVVAYAIVFMKEGRHLYPNLEPMFTNFEKISWQNKSLNSYHFYIMGQICVAKECRGKGVFDLLYQKHKEIYQSEFDFVITEISTDNHRSLRAHERIGFQTIATHCDQLDEWDVVLWNWK